MKIECVECEHKECFDCPVNMKTEVVYFNSSQGSELFVLDDNNNNKVEIE